MTEREISVYPSFSDASEFAAGAPVELTSEEEANLPRPIEVMSVGNEPYYDRLLKGNLAEWDMQVTVVHDDEIGEALEKSKPDMIIMSENASYKLFDVPETGKIVVLGKGRNTKENRIKFLDFGADGVVSKDQYVGDGYAAQVRAIHRRYQEKAHHPAKAPEINAKINEQARTVEISGKMARLGKRQFDLFRVLYSRYGGVLTYDEISTKAFGPEYRGEMGFLRTYLNRMKNELSKAGILDDFKITTQETMGYCMGIEFKEVEVNDEVVGEC